MRLTEEQAEIQDAAAALRPGESLKVVAFAGAGKTTTLKACAEARRDRGIYLAFNASIAKEAQERLASTKCPARTMHSVAWSVMRNMAGQPSALTPLDLARSDVMQQAGLPRIRGWGDLRYAAAVIRTMNAFAASADEDIAPGHARQALIDALGDPEVLQNANAERAEHVSEVLRMLEDPLARLAEAWWVNRMLAGSYSHDMYLKMLDIDEEMRVNAFAGMRYIMIDEAQDINPVQRSIITKTGLPLVAVGDPYQQIYSWRGAENALSQLPGQTLYLTQSFRFGEGIAADARRIFASRPDGGPEQQLQGAGPGQLGDDETYAIICRTNIGRLDEAIVCINRNIPVFVDNIESLCQEVDSALALKAGKTDEVRSPELKCFESWDEMKQVASYSKDPGLESLVDLVESGRAREVQQLKARQERQQQDLSGGKSRPQVLICTAHRSKGLEFDAVKLGDDWPDIDQMASRFAKASEMSGAQKAAAIESWNCLYVAVTRSIRRCSNHEKLLEPDRPDARNGDDAAASGEVDERPATRCEP
ncbi:MAG: AAA family ATPase [Boseongicola sp. SB0677_bin_26]|nr:AAA family ATPase [Boseongicola sp. SB0665_bin_10]MYG26941.1 AAA family ATPase [Boseongicola sp. SB0677_bin_26]